MLVCPLCRIALTPPEHSCPRDGREGVAHTFAELPAELAMRFRMVMPFAGSESASMYVVDALDSGKRGLLKLLRRAVNPRDQEALRARRELEKQRKISAPYVVVPWECGEAEGTNWLFRRWLDGVSLRVLLTRETPPAQRDALSMAAQLSCALDALHAQGLLHRDVHPGHVFIESRPGLPPLVQLLDAGLPNVSQRTDGPPQVGTAGYAAPEQLQGKLVSMRSDLYSAGAVIAEILQGQPVFPGESPAERLNAQLGPPKLTMSDTLAESVRGMVEALLSSDPQRRPFSAQKLRRTLDVYLPEGVSVTRQPTTPFSTQGPASAAPPAETATANAPAAPAGGVSAPRASFAPSSARAPEGALRPGKPSAPPPPPAAAMQHSRPPHPPTGRPSSRAPLPPPPRRAPEDYTQQLDEDLLEELAPRSLPPAPPARPPARPARANEDYTVPVRLDQILAVSQTPRTPSAAPPPAPTAHVAEPIPPVAPAPAIAAAPAPAKATLPPPAALPAAALPVASLPPPALLGSATQGRAKNLLARARTLPPAHAGTMFDPAESEAAAEAKPQGIQIPAALAQTLPAMPAAAAPVPEASELGGSDQDAFAPVAPHKVTTLGLGAPSIADVPEEPSDASEGDLSADVTTLMPRTPSDAPVAPVAAGYNATPEDTSATEVSPRAPYATSELTPDEITQPVRELSSSVRPHDDAQRKRYMVYGVAAAAVLLIGLGGRALFGGSDEAVEAAKPIESPVTAAVAAEPPKPNAAPAQAQRVEGAPQAKVAPLPLPTVTDLTNGKTTLPEIAVVPPPGPSAAELARIAEAEAAARDAAKAEAQAQAEADAAARAAAKAEAAAVRAEKQATLKAERAAKAEAAASERAEKAALAKQVRADKAQAAKTARASKAATAPKKAESAETTQAKWAAARDEAREHYAARRYGKAVEAYERATKLDPQNPGTFAGLGAARLQVNNARGAVDAYQHAVTLSPNTAGFHAALGRAFVAAGDPTRAKASYKRALALDPQNQSIAKALNDLG